MRFRKLDEKGDWVFGGGLQSLAEKNDAIIINATSRCNFWKNDYFANKEFGIDWVNFLSNKGNKANIEKALRTEILYVFGVVGITSFEITEQKNRELRIRIEIETIFSKNNEIFLSM